MSDQVKKIVFSTLLSLSIYGLATHVIDWGSKKCPFDTRKTKIIVLLVIMLVSLFCLFFHNRHKILRKKNKTNTNLTTYTRSKS